MTVEFLSDKLRQLAKLKEEKKRLSDLTKENGILIDEWERDIITAMLDMAEAAGLTNVDDFAVSVDGRRYSVVTKPFYSIPAERRDEAFQALRGLGLSDLIVERVDDRTLTRALVELADDAGGELPEQYNDIPLRKYEKMSISDRKVG